MTSAIATLPTPAAKKHAGTGSLLMRYRPVRTFVIALRSLKYLAALGPRQICWLVESLELQHGHIASRKRQLPIDAAGQPLPWYTYPAIQFISQLDLSDKDAFEFGSGNGSLFWATKTRSLVSVESDPRWHGMISARKHANQEVLLVEDLDEYANSVRRSGKKYDVIIVDGKRRRLCAQAAIPCLADDGILILDNSDWYPKTAELLRNAGLIQIDFTGYGPVNNYTWTTSLFLKRGVRMRPRGQRMPEPGIGSIVQTGEE